MINLVLKSILLFFAIAVGEVVNGILRVKFLNPRFGDFRSRQIALIPGLTIIYSIGWFMLPWVNPFNIQEAFLVGFILLMGMMLFDVFFARYVFKFSWQRVADDFNVLKGNFLPVGMAGLFFMPPVLFHVFK
ncbi:MAG: hypothetical protein ACOYXC_01245 [Candidatus Rifleibacteriota bacterium]